MDRKLTDKQTEAIAYVEKQITLHEKLAERLKAVEMPLLGAECSRFSKTLRNTLNLQIRVIMNPESFLFDNHKNVH